MYWHHYSANLTDGYAPCPPPPQNRRTRILWLFVSEAHYRSCYPKLLHLGQGAYLKRSAREMPNPVI
ncbi:MAG: hypothetical protein F6K35_48265 [Okeania sp. SIO2H7]|nr:hypothetical protein [Okeania sp. SIO2H7]